MGEAVRTSVKAPETKKVNQGSQVQKGNFYKTVSFNRTATIGLRLAISASMLP